MAGPRLLNRTLHVVVTMLMGQSVIISVVAYLRMWFAAVGIVLATCILVDHHHCIGRIRSMHRHITRLIVMHFWDRLLFIIRLAVRHFRNAERRNCYIRDLLNTSNAKRKQMNYIRGVHARRGTR